MECNKEEALRAKEIAEKKLEVQDYGAARKFILKAQQLFPALENVSQMLTVCEVHCAAQVKFNGCDMDWYGILQLDPTADDISIKKQYRKLALLLHPDKNKFCGAESAFKLIGEAMGVLSDQMKRTLHDMRRRAGINPNIAISKSSQFQSGATKSANGHFYGTQQPGVQTQPGINVRMQTQPAAGHQAQPNPAASGPTFWTICPFCQIKYQYMRTVENRYLLCQNCQRPFLAKDMHASVGNGTNAAGVNSAYAWNASSMPQQQGFPKQGANVRGPGTVPLDGFTNETQYDQNFASNMAFQGGMSGSARAANDPGDSYQEKAKKEADYLRQVQEKARQHAEAEKEARRKMKEEEKELKRREKEAERKARAEEKAREALRKIEVQRRAKAEKAGGNEKPRKRLRKVKESSSSDSDVNADGNIALEDDVSDGQRATGGDVGRKPRRSSRAKRNVTYRVDVSDDEDFVNFPPSKKSKEMKEGAGESAQNHAASSAEKNESGVKFEEDEPERMENQSHILNDMQQVLAEMAKKKISKGLQENFKQNLGSEIEDDTQGLKEEKDNEQSNPQLRKEEKSEEIKAACQPEGAKGIGENGVEKTALKDDNKGSHPESPSQSDSASSTSEPELFDVPDADFHDFDQDRTELNIAEGQVWAVYDDLDGMPRFYLRVNKVRTVKPLKVQISWLEWCPFREEHDHWESENLPVACGMFKMGKVRVLEGVNTFSHLVKWEKGKQKGHVNIYPRKGDIWAIYKNWQIDWENSDEDGGPKYEYEMVEVLTDFSEKTGVEVAHLIKVDGFKTLFKRQVEQGVEVTMQIPLNEFLKFSHQVPAYKMTGEEKCGEEKCGVLKGSWELDPASTPMELIHGESIKSNAR